MTAWLSALAMAFASGCTEPSFVSDQEDIEEADSGAPPEPGETERDDDPDTGSERPDGGGEPRDGGEAQAMTATCEGGTCRTLDAQMSATMPEAGGRDTEVEAGPALDEDRANWAGRYAARSAVFAYDVPFDGTARVLSVIEIVPTPEGGLRLQEELCYHEGEWVAIFTGTVKHRYNDALASAPLQYNGERFSSEQLTVRVGYGATPAGCNPGATIARQADQSWLSSTCDCPRSNDAPTSLRDCRVTDPDTDDKPGASFSASFNASPMELHMTQELRARLLEGYRRGDRLYAERWFEETTRLLSCTIGGAPASNDSCFVTPSRSCPARHNKVELVPIKEPIKCADVIAMEHSLFLAPLPGFPASCPAEISAPAP